MELGIVPKEDCAVRGGERRTGAGDYVGRKIVFKFFLEAR